MGALAVRTCNTFESGDINVMMCRHCNGMPAEHPVSICLRCGHLGQLHQASADGCTKIEVGGPCRCRDF